MINYETQRRETELMGQVNKFCFICHFQERLTISFHFIWNKKKANKNMLPNNNSIHDID